MDISTTIAPRSDQQNHDDYLAGDKTFTIADVTAGNAEQPVAIHLVEAPGRAYKPSKSMRRVLVAAWGPDASTYAGRRITLYGDPTVKFGGATVGGIKIRALSHIDKPLTLALTATRGKKAPHTVHPLADAPNPADKHITALQEAQSMDALKQAWDAAGAAGVAKDPRVEHAKNQRKGELAAHNEETNA